MECEGDYKGLQRKKDNVVNKYYQRSLVLLLNAPRKAAQGQTLSF